MRFYAFWDRDSSGWGYAEVAWCARLRELMGSITLVFGVALIAFNIFVLLVVNSFVDLPTIAVFGE